MLILSKNQNGGLVLRAWSSLDDKQLRKRWSLIARFLHDHDQAMWGLSDLIPDRPLQPEQLERLDCGVFLCGVVRWLVEEWPLATLNSLEMQALRRHTVREIENWTLY